MSVWNLITSLVLFQWSIPAPHQATIERTTVSPAAWLHVSHDEAQQALLSLKRHINFSTLGDEKHGEGVSSERGQTVCVCVLYTSLKPHKLRVNESCPLSHTLVDRRWWTRVQYSLYTTNQPYVQYNWQEKVQHQWTIYNKWTINKWII